MKNNLKKLLVLAAMGVALTGNVVEASKAGKGKDKKNDGKPGMMATVKKHWLGGTSLVVGGAVTGFGLYARYKRSEARKRNLDSVEGGLMNAAADYGIYAGPAIAVVGCGADYFMTKSTETEYEKQAKALAAAEKAIALAEANTVDQKFAKGKNGAACKADKKLKTAYAEFVGERKAAKKDLKANRKAKKDAEKALADLKKNLGKKEYAAQEKAFKKANKKDKDSDAGSDKSSKDGSKESSKSGSESGSDKSSATASEHKSAATAPASVKGSKGGEVVGDDAEPTAVKKGARKPAKKKETL